VHFEVKQVNEELISESNVFNKPPLTNQSLRATSEIVYEYYNLALLSEVSEAESIRINEILDLATKDNLINFWLSEIDHLLGHRLGLLDDPNRKSYADQKAMLREYLGINYICNSPTSENSCYPLNIINTSHI
jgi:hypothetical protein